MKALKNKLVDLLRREQVRIVAVLQLLMCFLSFKTIVRKDFKKEFKKIKKKYKKKVR